MRALIFVMDRKRNVKLFLGLLTTSVICQKIITASASASASADSFIDVPMPDCSDWVCEKFFSHQWSDVHCNCDKDCVLYGDCCYDYYKQMLNVTTTEDLLYQINKVTEEKATSDPLLVQWTNVVKDYGTCTPNLGPFKSESYNIITKCPDHMQNEELKDKCEQESDDFLSEVPVSYIIYHKNLHVAFRNMYCAACHGVPSDQLEAWIVMVKAECVNEEDENLRSKRIQPYTNIKSSCVDTKGPPNNAITLRFKCVPYAPIDECSLNSTNENNTMTMDSVCGSYFFGIQIDTGNQLLTFRNPHCVDCPYLNSFNKTCWSLPKLSHGSELLPSAGVSVIFNFRNGITVEINKNVYVKDDSLCDSNFIYDSVLQMCIEVVCPDTQRLGDSGCIYDETSWSFVMVPQHLENLNRTYEIVCTIETFGPIPKNAKEAFESIYDDNGHILISLSWSEESDLYEDDEPKSPQTTLGDIREDITSGSTNVRDAGNEHLTTNYLQMIDIPSGTTMTPIRSDGNITSTGDSSTTPASDDTGVTVWGPGGFHSDIRTTKVMRLNVNLTIEGRLNEILGDILQLPSILPEVRIVSPIEIINKNVSHICNFKYQDNVTISDVIKLNNSYFGIDNVSRILVDIDMTDFRLEFVNGQVSFAYLQFCRSRLLNCTMGRFQMTAFVFLENGTLIHKLSKRIINKGDYMINGNDVLACINMSLTTVEASALVSSHETLLSIIVETTSAICLLITGIVYCGCFGIRTRNRQCIMLLSFTLAFAQTLFLVPVVNGSTLCKVKAVALHFFWLSSFVWMLTLGYDYAKTFRVDKTQLRQSSKYLYVKYLSFSYGIPFVFVLSCVCIDEFISGQKVGYGNGVCWIGNQHAYRLVFALPVLVMIIVNCLFFVSTVIGINRAKFNKNGLMSARKRSFILIYVKLSILMGLTWVFGFIAGVVDNPVLWYFHIVLNGLQGLDIFIMFVLNKSTLQQLRKLKKKEKVFSNKLTMSDTKSSDLSHVHADNNNTTETDQEIPNHM